MADYFNSTEQEREDERTRRGWVPRPPIVHTHRAPGKPVTTGPRSARLDAKHRGEQRPLLAQFRAVDSTLGRTHV